MRGRGRLALAATLTAVLASASAAALDPPHAVAQHVRRTWTVENGLPQSSVTDLVQDRDGYLWISTFGGLARFDGVRFELFGQAAHPGLASDRLLSLAEDPAGGLWIGTERRGLARFEDGEMRPVVPFPDVASAHVLTLEVGPSGDLWAGTDRGLLHLGSDGVWERFGRRDGLPHDRVLSVLETAPGEVLAGTERGLVRLRRGRFEPVLARRLGARSIYALYRDSGGWTWAGGGGGLLLRWRGGEVVELPAEPADGTVRDLLEIGDGVIWAAYAPGGVRRIGRHDDERYRRADGLPSDSAEAFLEDREGNVWIGTSGGGLHQLSDGPALGYGGPGHPLSGSVLPIVDDGAGGIWAGLVCGGLAHLDPRDGRVERFAEAAGLANTCVGSLLHGGAGELWVGTLGGGLYLFRQGRFRFLGAPAGDESGMVRALLAGRDGLLVGTGAGLFRLAGGGFGAGDGGGVAADGGGRDGGGGGGDGEGGGGGGGEARFEPLPGAAELDVYALAEDAAGTLWIGSRSGPWTRRAGGGPVAPLAAAPEPLRGATVRALHFDAAGAVWMGTYGQGLFRYQGGRFDRFGRAEGLREEIVSFIAEDRHGRLWLTGNRGVQRIARRDLEAVAAGRMPRAGSLLFTAGDGMPASETNGGSQPAGLLTAAGELWVPTVDGVARFDTLAGYRRRPAPPVRIERVTVDGRALDPALLASGRRAELGSGVRNLEIHYTSPSFRAPGRVRFRHRLLGEDDDWIDAGGRRVAYFPFLPPGEHRFEVAVRLEDGTWSRQSTAFTFHVAPRLVDTPLLPLLLVTAVVLAAIAGARLRLRSLRSRERRLAAEVTARTAELERTKADLQRANQRLARLASVDALTGIPNRRVLMERLGAEWRRSVRQGHPIGLLMIDLDHFKAFNDLHGHPAGDRCLHRVAAILDASLRRADEMLARYGGEELTALIPEVPSVAALRELAERMRRRIEEARLPHGGSAVSEWVTVSLGGAVVVPDLGGDPADLVAAADAALYRAKQRGRNRVEVAEPEAAAPRPPPALDPEDLPGADQGQGQGGSGTTTS